MIPTIITILPISCITENKEKEFEEFKAYRDVGFAESG
jgi:hypothetical protein